MKKPKIIFLGNGLLAEVALDVLTRYCEVIFWAKTAEDLEKVAKLREETGAFGVLASFGKILPKKLLDKFEPEGILNIHPSLLPKYRGPSPIESAILAGEEKLGVSVMKISEKMDAGPIYFRAKVDFGELLKNKELDAIEIKQKIYTKLASRASEWIGMNLTKLQTPVEQEHEVATYTKKLNTEMSLLRPAEKGSKELAREIVALAGFPKSRFNFFGKDCIVLRAWADTDHRKSGEQVESKKNKRLEMECTDGGVLVVEKLQPAGKKAMSARDFLNGQRVS